MNILHLSRLAVPSLALLAAVAVRAYGADGAAHHRMGMHHAATLLHCPVVELAGCRHDAPLSHPDLFRTEVIDPLMRRVGPPWTADSG